MSKGARVRIVAGSAGGLFIPIPKGFKSRPTQDRVKQAIFSSLGALVTDADILDLYAGTGALGIEALSRGAAHCTFVDKDRSCTTSIKSSLKHCKLTGATVITQSAIPFLMESPAPSSHDLILLDPPYLQDSQDLAKHPLAQGLARYAKPGAHIIWEHESRNPWSSHPAFDTLKQVRYGDTTVLHLLRGTSSDQPGA